ncbi:MAG: hypothetical protein ACRELY_04220 [Polyangiaceae bacterium]
MTASLRLRLCLGFAWALVSATFFYGLVRGIQAWLFPEANPATIIWSAHAGYFWRIWIVLYGSGVVGFLAFYFASTQSEKLTKWLKNGVIVAAVTIAVQALLLP